METKQLDEMKSSVKSETVPEVKDELDSKNELSISAGKSDSIMMIAME